MFVLAGESISVYARVLIENFHANLNLSYRKKKSTHGAIYIYPSSTLVRIGITQIN